MVHSFGSSRGANVGNIGCEPVLGLSGTGRCDENSTRNSVGIMVLGMIYWKSRFVIFY